MSHDSGHRTVSIQCGKPTNFKGTTTSVQNHMTPTKNINSNMPMKNSTPDIKFLPGKKQPAAGTTSTKKTKNKCEICKVIYESKEDKVCAKQYNLQNQWLGCDNGCDYWVHARCVDIKVLSKKLAKTIPFTCPAHT